MITDGSSALKLSFDPKTAEMEAYLSAENGYWLENDVWRTDSKAYKEGGLAEPYKEGVLVDFSPYTNSLMKLEMKYYLLFSMKQDYRFG